MTTSELEFAAETTQRSEDPANPLLTRIRLVLLALYGVIALVVFMNVGVPFDREGVILWTCGALALACIGRPVREAFILVRDWLPFTLFLILYDYTRGAADTLGVPVRENEMIAADRVFGLGEIPTIRFQEWFYTPDHVHWYDVAVTLVYISHFFAVYVIAGLLWARNRKRFGEFVRRFMALTAAGLATYILFPATPPWLASDHGEIGDVHRISGRGWSALGLHRAESVLQKGQATVNQVAAMPSLHAAFAALITAFFWRQASWWLRIILVAYPLAMAWALIYSGEHYLIDVLLGWAYVAGVMVGVGRLERWWRERRAPSVATPDDRTAVPDTP